MEAKVTEVCGGCGRPMFEPTCIDCLRIFPMSKSDRVFHLSRYGELPPRCPDCRRAKREWRQHQQRIGQVPDEDTTPGRR